MVTEFNKDYEEFLDIVRDIYEKDEFKSLDYCSHHYGVSRKAHCINVAYYSYVICKKAGLDYVAAARGGLLHDLFHYECRSKRFGALKHAALHPKLALRNAEKLTKLSPKERDIILTHMFLCAKVLPHCRESYIVSMVDKYCAIWEAVHGAKCKFKSVCFE